LNVVSVIQSPSTQIAAIPDFAEFTAPEIPKYIEYFLAKEASPTAAYGYGNRLQAYFGVNQIDSIVADLQRSEFSRRALAILWDPRTDSDSANPPCLTTIQASIREGRLQLTSFVRSHDVFRAYPLNAAALAELQARLATQLGVIGPGPLTLVSQSAHIYSDCWHSASSSLAVQGRHTKFDQDLRGSFVFRLSGSDLIADHYSVQGDWLQNFAATSANTLFRLLSPFVSRVDHALYLGREIARLEFSRKSGTVYRQDRTD
jgi:thymidylate synthase